MQKLKGVDGISEGYHGLSHHGRDEDKIKQLTLVEQAVIDEWTDFLRKLKKSELRQHNGSSNIES